MLLLSRLNYKEVESSKQSNLWSDSKLKALTDFVLSSQSWPSHKQVAFGRVLANFMKNRGVVGNVCKSGMRNRHFLYVIEPLYLHATAKSLFGLPTGTYGQLLPTYIFCCFEIDLNHQRKLRLSIMANFRKYLKDYPLI